jgi:hypothetical protein
MSDFPYKKAKAALQKYSLPEVERLSIDLLKLYQAGHAEKGDMAVGLEKWVLRVCRRKARAVTLVVHARH